MNCLNLDDQLHMHLLCLKIESLINTQLHKINYIRLCFFSILFCFVLFFPYGFDNLDPPFNWKMPTWIRLLTGRCLEGEDVYTQPFKQLIDSWGRVYH